MTTIYLMAFHKCLQILYFQLWQFMVVGLLHSRLTTKTHKTPQALEEIGECNTTTTNKLMLSDSY